MKRSEKVTAVEEMNEVFKTTPHVILASFRGLGVNQANALRSKVRGAGGRYRVIKNRLAKLAAEGTPAAELAANFGGPCALATHDSDPVVLAKTLQDFSKENPQIELVAAVIDSQDLLDAAGVKHLASLPGLPELRAQLLSVILAPATQIARVLSAPGEQLARVLDARKEKLEAEG